MIEVAINKAEWTAFVGQTVDSRYRLLELLRATKGKAEFRADVLGEGGRAMVELFDAEACDVFKIRKRYVEASTFDHPNLLWVKRIAEAGSLHHELFYVALDYGEYTLEQAVSGGKLGEAELRDAAIQVARGLAYLESQGFTYRALGTESVWRAGERWKLANYAELRPLDRSDRPAPVRLLGSMLAKIVSPEGRLGDTVAACLDAGERDGWSLEQIIAALDGPKAAEADGARSHAAEKPEPKREDPRLQVANQPKPVEGEHAPSHAAEKPETMRDGHLAPARPQARFLERTLDPEPVDAPPPKRRKWLWLVIAVLVAALAFCLVRIGMYVVESQGPAIPQQALKEAAHPRSLTTGSASPASKH